MARTLNPKYASYMGDGSGRDSYIILNNGGLTKQDKGHMMSRPFRRTFANFSPSPKKDAVSHVYQSDGSGRDSYVLQNSGGLVSDYKGSSRADINFVAGLRNMPAQVLPSRTCISPLSQNMDFSMY